MAVQLSGKYLDCEMAVEKNVQKMRRILSGERVLFSARSQRIGWVKMAGENIPLRNCSAKIDHS